MAIALSGWENVPAFVILSLFPMAIGGMLLLYVFVEKKHMRDHPKLKALAWAIVTSPLWAALLLQGLKAGVHIVA